MIDSVNKNSEARHLVSFAVAASCLVFACGCGRALERAASGAAVSAVDRIVAQPNSTVELLEAELRWMEDNLYRMDDQLDNALIQLQSARRNNAILRLELAEARRATPVYPAGSTGSSVLRSNANRNKTGSQPNGSNGDYDEETSDLDASDPYNLDIQLGEPASKSPKLESADGPQLPDPAALSPGSNENLPNPVDPRVLDGASGVPTPAPLPNNIDVPGGQAPDPNGIQPEPMKPNPFLDDTEDSTIDRPGDVTRILLNPRLTGGYNFDGQPGHEGIIVVIEPQNAYAQYVPVAGDVTVEVFDPTKSGLAGRVGKWKFDAVEANTFLKKSLMGKGVHLQLPWPGAPPENRELTLSVNYETSRGRILEAKKNLLVEPLTATLVEKANAAEQQNWSPYRTNNLSTRTTDSSKWPDTSKEKAEVTARAMNWQPNR